MKDLKQPARPLFQDESDVDMTIHSNEESEEEDYHMWRQQNKGKDLFEEILKDIVKYNPLC